MNAKIDFSKISFLIVDGDKISAQVVYDTLAYLGASHIQRVKTPNDAFDVLRSEKIDIVVCEWRLRGMDGLEFLDVMRNSTNSPNRFIPVIMLLLRSGPSNWTCLRRRSGPKYVPVLMKRLGRAMTDTQFDGPDRRSLDE